MKDGDIPALSSGTQAQTRREWVENFFVLSADVDGCTFITALQRSVAILLTVMNSNGAFLVLQEATGMLSGCARQRVIMTIRSAPRMGHIAASQDQIYVLEK
jgi:hypothetical protein